MESNMETKKCSRCGRELPVTEFGKNKSAKDGLQVFCKECFRQYARNKKADAPKQGGGLQPVYTNPQLANFTPRQLMEELKARGFRWEYMLEPQRKIYYDKI